MHVYKQTAETVCEVGYICPTTLEWIITDIVSTRDLAGDLCHDHNAEAVMVDGVVWEVIRVEPTFNVVAWRDTVGTVFVDKMCYLFGDAKEREEYLNGNR